jgi:hypothetical protein
MPDKRDAKWKAVQDRQPLPPFSLRVTGKPLMPTPGHRPVLKRAEPQGINPRILMLELTATPPAEPASDIVTPVAVEYVEGGTQEFDQVTVRSQVATEPGATIDVEVIH